MAGELSKKIGEKGEDIVEELFKRFLGYPEVTGSNPIPCVHQESHQEIRKKEIKSHGNDGIVYHNSPLDDATLEIGFISSKYSDQPYPKSPSRIFRNHFIDLITGLECFMRSNELSDIQRKTTKVNKTRVIGLLFWLSNNDESRNEDVIHKLTNTRLSSIGIPFDQVILIDNARLQFIVQVVEYAKFKSNNNYDFVYPNTGFNIMGDTNKSYGKRMPLEFFANEILPLRYEINDDVIFHLACSSEFSENNFERVISSAKLFDKLKAIKKIIISFTNYNVGNHLEIEMKVKNNMDDQQFTNIVEVISIESDFRNLLK
jgi:hypothetical protein